MIIKRDLYKKIKPYINSPEAIVVTGMRRVGKTFLLRYIYEKIQSDNKIFLDLENPLNQKYFEEDNYENIKLTLGALGVDINKKAYVFLDEIHYFKKLPSIVKYLFDHYQIKFFLTGSASFYLKNLFTESLAGRKYIFELFPLSFKEFLLFKGSKLKLPDGQITKPIFSTFTLLYDEYLQFGGFPAVVLKESVEEKKISLADIFSSYFQLEVLQLSDYRNTKVMRDLILLIAQRCGARIDISKLARELGISWETANNYLAFLESTYFIKLIKPFSRNKDVEIRRSSKAYLCDSGLLNSIAKVDEGKIFENNIFQNLRLKGELNYYQRKDGQEIDFIINKKKAFEAKIAPSVQDEKRLARLAADLKIKDWKIIAKNYSDLKTVVYGFMI